VPRLLRTWRQIRALASTTHDAQLRAELQLHMELLAEEYVAQGLSPTEARARAQREFGNPTRIQETSHELFSIGWLEQLMKDLSYAGREARRSPGFTAVAVLSLAVALGAVTTTAAVVDALLLRGLPAPHPDRLVAFSRGSATTWSRWSYAAFRQWADGAEGAFQAAAVYSLSEIERPLLPAADARPSERLRVSLVSGAYFDVLGITPARGRTITTLDDRAPGAHPVAVISHGFWMRHFGGAPDVVGRPLELNDVAYEVIGVAPEQFTGEWVGLPTDVWLPLAMHGAITRSRAPLLSDGSTAQWLRVMARLDDDTSLPGATATANVLWQRVDDGQRAARAKAGTPPEAVVLLSAATGYAPLRQQYSRPMMLIASVVGIVLVIACANFANLLYGRSRSRQQEFAVRLVLGAGHWRIVRQSLVECSMLAGIAAAIGVTGAAWATTGTLKRFAATLQPLEFDLRLDPRVLGVAGGCTLLVIAFGLMSSMRWVRAPVSCLSQAAMRERRRNLIGRLFLVGQLTLCVVLLIGTGLMLRSVDNLRTQHLGFDRNLLLVTVAPAQAGYTGEAANLLLKRIHDHLLALRDIQAVSASGAALLDSRTYWVDKSERLVVDGCPPVSSGATWTFADVGAAFFRTVGLPILRGRDFTQADVSGPSDAIIVNRSMARLLFGADDPLGHRIGMAPNTPGQLVVGVVDDARQTSPRDRGLPVMYRPLQRTPPQLVLAVRTQGSAADSVDVVRHQLFGLDRDLPIVAIETIEEVLNEAIGQERMLGALAAWLGALVIVISCIGLHALIANDVIERTHELGVRLALGATRAGIADLVLRECAVVTGVALAAGVPLGLAAVTPLTSQLYGVAPNDPHTVLLVILLLLTVGLVAAVRPALAAARVDPLVLLRAD
jgi:predicted permease